MIAPSSWVNMMTSTQISLLFPSSDSCLMQSTSIQIQKARREKPTIPMHIKRKTGSTSEMSWAEDSMGYVFVRKLGGSGYSGFTGGALVFSFFRGIFQGKERGKGWRERDESCSMRYGIHLGRCFRIKGSACLFFFGVSSGGLLISDRGGFGRLLADVRRFWG